MIDDRARGRRRARRRQSASLRRRESVSGEGDSRGPARPSDSVRCLREMASIGCVLLAADQGQLGDRGRRRADQPGDPSGGSAAMARRARSATSPRCGRLARRTRSNRKTSSRALLRYENGATGVIQASTSIVPGYPERLELHGIERDGDHFRRRARRVGRAEDDAGEPAPVATDVGVGRVGPDGDLADAVRAAVPRTSTTRSGPARPPLVSGEAGCEALEIVERIYNACRRRWDGPVFHSLAQTGTGLEKCSIVEDPRPVPERAKTVENRPAPNLSKTPDYENCARDWCWIGNRTGRGLGAAG